MISVSLTHGVHSDEKALEQCMTFVADQPYELPENYQERKDWGDAAMAAICILKHCKIADCCEEGK